MLGYDERRDTKPGSAWKEWGTIFNRKIEVRDSKLQDAGRGLFAGPPSEDFAGFKKGQVITLYGGELLTGKPAKESAAEHTHMLRISTKGGSAPAWVDGRQFADGLTRQEVDGRFVYLPDPNEAFPEARLHQGAGSVMNDPTYAFRKEWINAMFEFKPLGTGPAAHLRPQVPVVVAKKYIAPEEEIFVSYGSHKPMHGLAVTAGARAPAADYRSLAAADDEEEVPAYKSMAAAADSDDAADEVVEGWEDEELLAKLRELGW